MTPTPKNPDAERLALADELEQCAKSCEVYSPDQCATLIDGIGWIAMRHKLTRAAEQLRALEQPAQEGWVLVPVEPTQPMLTAFAVHLRAEQPETPLLGLAAMHRSYAAMIAAAPTKEIT